MDDLGWSDLSFNGSEYYETPNVDALRERGTSYSDAYACAANSAPSRACMISGQYSPRHGVYTVAPSDRGKSEDRKLIPCETAEALAKGEIPQDAIEILSEEEIAKLEKCNGSN